MKAIKFDKPPELSATYKTPLRKGINIKWQESSSRLFNTSLFWMRQISRDCGESMHVLQPDICAETCRTPQDGVSFRMHAEWQAISYPICKFQSTGHRVRLLKRSQVTREFPLRPEIYHATETGLLREEKTDERRKHPVCILFVLTLCRCRNRRQKWISCNVLCDMSSVKLIAKLW